MSGKKGSPFERQTCKDLSLWWSLGSDDNIFWRTSQSGGRATTRGKKGKKTRAHCGDICSLDHEGVPFTNVVTLELKRGYTKSTIHDMLDKAKRAARQMFEAWIIQAVLASHRADTPFWMIVHKRDKRDTCVFFPSGLLHQLQELGCLGGTENPIPYPNIGMELSIKTPYDEGVFEIRYAIIGMRLAHFCADVSPNDFRILDKRFAVCASEYNKPEE